MFFPLLFVAALAFNGVLSEETIERLSCAGSDLFGRRCEVKNAQRSDIGMLEAKLVNGTDECLPGRYYIDLQENKIYVVALAHCTGLFDVVKLDPPQYIGGCGVNYDSDGFKIIGGSRVPACQYPWMVWITAGSFSCGGFIIDKDHIGTVAHCMRDPEGGFQTADKIQVVSGNIHKISGVKRSVKQVITHPNYIASHFINDIAILRLNESIKFDGCENPVCIGNDPNYAASAGSNCRMMGWGRTRDGRTPWPQHWLHWAPETIISDDQCKKEFPFDYPDGSVICSKASGTSFCTGDSGSPLVCLDGNKWFAYGIISVKKGRSCSYNAGLYTSVPFYYKWINGIIDNA